MLKSCATFHPVWLLQTTFPRPLAPVTLEDTEPYDAGQGWSTLVTENLVKKRRIWGRVKEQPNHRVVWGSTVPNRKRRKLQPSRGWVNHPAGHASSQNRPRSVR